MTAQEDCIVLQVTQNVGCYLNTLGSLQLQCEKIEYFINLNIQLQCF
jgi:hypothetical protein